MELEEERFLNELKEDDELGIDLDNFNLEEELRNYEDITVYYRNVLIRKYWPNTAYARDKFGKKTLIIAPESSRQKARYSTCVGLIVKMGPRAFKGDDFMDESRLPQIGDWVLTSRYSHNSFSKSAIPMQYILDRDIHVAFKNPIGICK